MAAQWELFTCVALCPPTMEHYGLVGRTDWDLMRIWLLPVWTIAAQFLPLPQVPFTLSLFIVLPPRGGILASGICGVLETSINLMPVTGVWDSQYGLGGPSMDWEAMVVSVVVW